MKIIILIRYSFWAEQKQTIFLSVLLLVTILLGGVFYFFRKAIDDLIITTPPTETIQTQAKIILQPVPIETHQVLGVVEKISSQEITLKDVTKSMNANSGAENQEARMIVMVDQSTTMERLSYKDGSTITRESDVAHEGAQENQVQGLLLTPPAPIEPFTREKITLSDIRTDDVVSVAASGGVLTGNQFVATEIVVMVMPDSVPAISQ